MSNTQTDRIEAAVARLQDEAKCRDRVDQALQFLDYVERRNGCTYGEMDARLREILTGARDRNVKSINPSGRKGPGFSRELR